MGDNIKMDLRESLESVDWVNLARERGQWWTLINTVINLEVPQKASFSLTT
jgi:hypothetical protein